ncbi:MAG: aldolase/citrate lyase family protein [Pseudomonadota bacterium]
MIDLLTITNDPALAARCDKLEGMRVFVDLERDGKAERQKGLDTFISTHHVDDVGRIRAVLKHTKLMVRVNPFQIERPELAQAEVDAVLAQGADLLMLPMFTGSQQLRAFAQIVNGRAPIVALLETSAALSSIDEWVATPGIYEVLIGLNDLHLSLGCRFMFEPLLMGHVDRVASVVKRQGLRLGFGGIARVDEGVLPGREVLGEHIRLGSQSVILSRTFNRLGGDKSFEEAVAAIRAAEAELRRRSDEQTEQDRLRVAGLIRKLSQPLRVPA